MAVWPFTGAERGRARLGRGRRSRREALLRVTTLEQRTLLCGADGHFACILAEEPDIRLDRDLHSHGDRSAL